MIRGVYYLAAGALAACVLAAIEDGSLTGTSARAAAGLGGLAGLIAACIHSAVLRSLGRHPVELPAGMSLAKSDKMLVRGTVILLALISPIVLAWVDRALASRDPHWISSFLSHFLASVLMAFSVAVGAFSIWLVIRWVNRVIGRIHALNEKKVEAEPRLQRVPRQSLGTRKAL